MTKATKILGILNLITAVVIWLPMLSDIPLDNGSDSFFGNLDRLMRSILLVCLVYSFQGILVFVKKLDRWDMVSSALVLLITMYFSISFDRTKFWIGTIPVAVYLLLQIWRTRIPDNWKLMYLNVWNIVLVLLNFYYRA
jgi:hypothetical protein